MAVEVRKESLDSLVASTGAGEDELMPVIVDVSRPQYTMNGSGSGIGLLYQLIKLQSP